MKKLIIFIVFIFTFCLVNFTVSATATPADSTKNSTDQIKPEPGKYEHVDVKIIYPWNEDEPEWYRDVSCLLVKENGAITELKIFLKDCTEVMKVKKGLFSFEVYHSKTNKLIAKGPEEG